MIFLKRLNRTEFCKQLTGREFISANELAELCGVSGEIIRRYIRGGFIPATKVSTMYSISVRVF